MVHDDSIRTDASTVHRGRGPVSSNAGHAADPELREGSGGASLGGVVSARVDSGHRVDREPAEEGVSEGSSRVGTTGEPVSDGGSVSDGDSVSERGDHGASVETGEPVEVGEPVEGVESDEAIAEAQTVIRGSSRAPVGSASVGRTPAAVAQVLLGQRLNHFWLEELIGGGGMGAVFRARDEKLDRTVAIKVIPFVGDDPDLKRRFRNEAQSAAKLDHPHIARVFEVGEQDDWHYIVFEYVRGVNIRDKVARDGVLSIDDAVFVTCQLAEALQHSADRGIVHRDIKPSNVLIGEDDQIKLVDMGLARSDNFELSEDMTASGVTLGTFDYISPEQARDPRDADVRSDIYSLGCTLYYMVTGRPPFPGGTMLQKLLSHGNSPPPDARALRSEVSDDLMAVIRKMLAKAPEDRYQNALDLILDLRQIAQREGLARSRSVAAIMVAEPNRLLAWLERHSPWISAAALLLLSAGWLQLHSAISRDTFSIAVPESLPVLEIAETSVASPGEMESENEPGDAGVAELTEEGDRAGESRDPDGGPSGTGGVVGETVDGDRDRGEGKGDDGDGSDPGEPVPTEVPGPRLPITPPSTVRDQDEERGASESEVRDDESADRFDAAAEPIDRIRVVGTGLPLDRGAQQGGVAVTRTLAEAVRMARRESVERIEVATSEIETRPLEFGDLNLTIVSTVEGGTVISFRSEEVVAMQRSMMVRVGSGRATFENLHFIWTVPVGEVDGGAVFALHPSGSVRMTDCTLTVENSSRREEVYAFDVVTDPEAIDPNRRELSVPEGDGSLPLVAIELNRAVVRGEMSMIRMDFAAELQLRFSNGLLAISRRMLDTAGALERPTEAAGGIQLSLEQVTARVPRGLVRMRLGVSGAYPLNIDRDAVKCVFVVDEGVPHVEVTGLKSLTDERSLLSVRGEANAYDASPSLSDPFYRRSDEDGNIRTTRLIDVLPDSPDPPDWWEERSPRWTVRWTKIELPNVSPSQLVPSDFRQDGIPALIRGFEEERLPRPPAYPRGVAPSAVLFPLPPSSDLKGFRPEKPPGI